MQCAGCYTEITSCELYVDDHGLVCYHLLCFQRFVVPIIIALITLAREGSQPCSAPTLQVSTVPVANVN
jgi:hypothetical protein